MFNTFYKTTLFYKQQDAVNSAKDKGHSFLFCVDNLTLNREGKRTYSYGSEVCIGKFLSMYNSLESDRKHFYEVIPDDIPIYEYYDLDLKIEETQKEGVTNDILLSWFKAVRKEFIRCTSIISHDNEDFIITTASNNKKISLHILNRAVVFKDKRSLKKWYEQLKSFLYSFYEEDPFKHSVDFSVCSSYRSMRIIHSSKFDHPDRPLKLLYDKDINNEPIYPIHTFITNAGKDILLENKLVSFEEEFKKDKITKTTNNVYTTYSNESITELLSLLSPDRAGDYEDWIRVGWALKREGVDINIFKDWSKQNSTTKYDKCDGLWKSECKDGVTLGTIHYFAKLDNPEGYKKFIEKNKTIKISFPFTPSVKINQKYITQDTYSQNLINNDVVCLKSNMNTGKTWCLPNLFPDYPVKVVVYFRISLNVSIYNKWKDYGFELYSDIKDDVIKTEKHPNIIIQIDSLHRIQGKVDLLLLDEIESTHEHICGSQYIDKNREYASLRNLIKYTPKIICMDANLKDETVNMFFNKKKVVKVQNYYHSFSHLKCDFYNDKTALINKLYEMLSAGKNIVIPTNSKKLANNLYATSTKKFPKLKVLKMDSDSDYTDVTKWDEYNVVIYTPKIVAGVSFDKLHFHSVVAFFINNSSNAEPSSQMLFRVRHLIDNNMFIHTPSNSKDAYLPIEKEDIESKLNNLVKEGKYPIEKTGLSVDKFNERIKKDDYYLIFREYTKKKNISKQYFYSYLKYVLRNHGIKCDYITSFCLPDIKAEIVRDIKDATLELKVEESEKIANAEVIFSHQYSELIENKERTEEENYSMKRYNLLKAYDIPLNDDISSDWVTRAIPYTKTYKNYKLFKDEDNINSCILSSEKYHEEKYENDMFESQLVNISSSEGSGYDCDDEEVNGRLRVKKINIKRTICHALTYDKKFLKMKFCLQFIKEAGFNSLYYEGKLRLNWDGLYNFIYRENRNISDIFECKQFKFISKEFDPEDGDKKRELMKFVNRKLESCFGVKISRLYMDSECQEYVLQVLFKDII
jgi:hypothetical protein